ncbi:hypothetical protein LTR93_007864 [Exophiala xenobiotica]|nr:hypothetical protein LTR93_007864 [Exophiala xenobiotica]KAK5419771.1 hypothetical protein LTR06_001240 [Exophiala xenobiotica]
MADHDHDHTHHHADSHGTSLHDTSTATDNTAFTEANRAHWNKSAATYTSEGWQKELLNKVTAFIQTHITFIGVPFLDPASIFEHPDDPDPDPDPSHPHPQPPRSVRVLDYACGPGTVTSALGAHATEYIGIDLSENMVAAYNQRFNSNNTTSHSSSNSNPSSAVADRADTSDERPPQAHAVVGNLLAAEDDELEPNGPTHLSGPEYHDFDLVVVGLGFHHFADVRLAAKRLSARLKPGGVFLILDFVTHAAIQHEHDAHRDLKDAAHTVKHHGFSEADLRDIFTDAAGAGLEDFAIVRMGEEVLLRGTSRREPFMARGRKPKPRC